ncbi:cadherin repeat domain-containing protein, partial [Vibrio sp. 10N.261.55.A7]|uniref:cadherin repeat domain-containing protein n=1 Tax=Vibrio sp. 10N.261.55.A7 TaxID=1880851 RepID=UPI0018E49731
NLDDNEPEFEQPDGYEFNYSENNVDTHAIGQVTASDADGEDVTYSISTNVYAADDVLEESPFFVIDSDDGEIRLTAEGVLAFTNDFELLNNVHNLVVTATEVGSFGGEPKSTDVNVVLNEINVNEAPEAEDFEAYLRDPDSPVPIVFDSNDPEFDHIWDTDEIIPGNNESVMVMITSLPSTGTLYYTDENDVRTELTELDLYTEGGGGTILDPSKVEYEQGEGDAFTIGGHPDDVEKTDGFYNWGDKESKTERRIDLDNETSIRVSVINDNGKPLKQYAADGHKGYGIGDKDGNGMNANEILVIDLSENPLEEITFGLDGMQQAFVHAQSIQVTYTLQDGTTQVEEYHKDSALGPHKFYEEFTYSSEDNPIVGMAMEGSGSNWVLRGFSGELAITEDDSFDYLAIDSGGLVSEEATVTIPPYVEHAATLEDELLSGTDDTDVFKWSDATINDGTDTIEDFNFYEDLIDLTGVLDDGSAVDIEDLMGIASAEVVDDDVVITVNADNSADEEVSQTIVITDGATILEDFIPTNSALDQLELLSQVLKTDAA